MFDSALGPKDTMLVGDHHSHSHHHNNHHSNHHNNHHSSVNLSWPPNGMTVRVKKEEDDVVNMLAGANGNGDLTGNGNGMLAIRSLPNGVTLSSPPPPPPPTSGGNSFNSNGLNSPNNNVLIVARKRNAFQAGLNVIESSPEVSSSQGSVVFGMGQTTVMPVQGNGVQGNGGITAHLGTISPVTSLESSEIDLELWDLNENSTNASSGEHPIVHHSANILYYRGSDV